MFAEVLYSSTVFVRLTAFAVLFIAIVVVIKVKDRMVKTIFVLLVLISSIPLSYGTGKAYWSSGEGSATFILTVFDKITPLMFLLPPLILIYIGVHELRMRSRKKEVS